MKEIIFQQNIEIDPYEDWEHGVFTIIDSDYRIHGSIDSNFDTLAKDGLFGNVVKGCVEDLECKYGDDMYDNDEYKQLIDNTLSRSHIKFKRDESTGDNTLYSWEEWQKIPYTRLISYTIYGNEVDKAAQECSIKDIEEVLSSNNPLIKLIADCLISSNDAHLRVRQMIKDGCDVDIKFLEDRGMYFGGFNKGDI